MTNLMRFHDVYLIFTFSVIRFSYSACVKMPFSSSSSNQQISVNGKTETEILNLHNNRRQTRINMNLDEANRLRKEILDLGLFDAKGIEIERITIPNQDDSKYEGLALKIKRTTKRLEDNSYDVLEDFCRKRNLKISKTIEKEYWIIYTPKRLQSS